jgi:hypothetical protein
MSIFPLRTSAWIAQWPAMEFMKAALEDDAQLRDRMAMTPHFRDTPVSEMSAVASPLRAVRADLRATREYASR